MSERKRDYEIGYGKPPTGPALSEGPIRQPAHSARPERLCHREAIVAQMVDKSTRADLRAIKMLADMQKEAEAKAGTAPPEPAQSTVRAKLAAEDREVVELFVSRLRQQIAAEAAADPHS
jgi:hypothetical protein